MARWGRVAPARWLDGTPPRRAMRHRPRCTPVRKTFVPRIRGRDGPSGRSARGRLHRVPYPLPASSPSSGSAVDSGNRINRRPGAASGALGKKTKTIRGRAATLRQHTRGQRRICQLPLGTRGTERGRRSTDTTVRPTSFRPFEVAAPKPAAAPAGPADRRTMTPMMPEKPRRAMGSSRCTVSPPASRLRAAASSVDAGMGEINRPAACATSRWPRLRDFERLRNARFS